MAFFVDGRSLTPFIAVLFIFAAFMAWLLVL